MTKGIKTIYLFKIDKNEFGLECFYLERNWDNKTLQTVILVNV